MIDYVRRRPDGRLDVVRHDGAEVASASLTAFMDRIALTRLSSSAAAAKAVGRLFDVRRLAPLFLDADTLLVPLRGLRHPECMLVNHFAVVSCAVRADGSGVVMFRDGRTLTVPSYAVLRRQVRLAQRIETHLRASGNR
jgi:hypothetical protein